MILFVETSKVVTAFIVGMPLSGNVPLNFVYLEKQHKAKLNTDSITNQHRRQKRITRDTQKFGGQQCDHKD
eukprot:5604808-Amphidinium_carterae.1